MQVKFLTDQQKLSYAEKLLKKAALLMRNARGGNQHFVAKALREVGPLLNNAGILIKELP